MTVWTALVPMTSVLAAGAAIGLVLDLARGRDQRAAALWKADEMRARATLDYYNRVHDSMSG